MFFDIIFKYSRKKHRSGGEKINSSTAVKVVILAAIVILISFIGVQIYLRAPSEAPSSIFVVTVTASGTGWEGHIVTSDESMDISGSGWSVIPHTVAHVSINEDGSSTSYTTTEESWVPLETQQFQVEGTKISVTTQKLALEGELEVSILKDSERIAFQSTEAPFGVIVLIGS